VQKFLLKRRVEKWREKVRNEAKEFIRRWAKQQGIDIRDVELGLAIEQLIRLRQRHEQAVNDERELDQARSFANTRPESAERNPFLLPPSRPQRRRLTTKSWMRKLKPPQIDGSASGKKRAMP
jgi:hypothetical protein